MSVNRKKLINTSPPFTATHIEHYAKNNIPKQTYILTTFTR